MNTEYQVPSIDDEPEVMDIPRDPRTENKKHYVFAGTKLLSASGASKIDLPESSTGKGEYRTIRKCIYSIASSADGSGRESSPSALIC